VNQIKSMFLGYLSIHFIVNEMTDELLLNEYYLTDSYLSAEKNLLSSGNVVY